MINLKKLREIVRNFLPRILLNILRGFKKIIYFKKNYNLIASPASGKDNFERWLYLLYSGNAKLIYIAYFKSIFDWKSIDSGIIKELSSISMISEGHLLDAFNGLRVRTQVNFLASIIKQNNVRRILETGTHKAMFCYVARLCDGSITIDTFDIHTESQRAVDILNQKYGPYIRYYQGDSGSTLSNFFPNYHIDFAWIDGGHSFECCFSDLENCARLGISSIAVDDYKWIVDVSKAVVEFTEKYKYSIAEISNLADYRGIVHLVKSK